MKKKDHSLNPIGLDGQPIAGEPCGEEESTLGRAEEAETSLFSWKTSSLVEMSQACRPNLWADPSQRRSFRRRRMVRKWLGSAFSAAGCASLPSPEEF